MSSGPTTLKPSTRLVGTDIPDSWAWMRVDLPVRILPFALLYTIVYQLETHRSALGLSAGQLEVQLVFGAVAAPLMFAAAVWVQLWLTRRRGALSVPATSRDALFQADFYVVNGAVEEAFFRCLLHVVAGGG